VSGGGLSPAELAALEAVLDRLIPADESGPGAVEAKVLRYVVRRLGGPDAAQLGAYREGLARLDAEAAERHGTGFAGLPANARDELLRAAEARTEEPFFELVLAHATEGMFGDPVHGGNAGGAGWRLIGYPGPRYVWTERDQRLGSTEG
jgi:hypothetical protein